MVYMYHSFLIHSSADGHLELHFLDWPVESEDLSLDHLVWDPLSRKELLNQY